MFYKKGETTEDEEQMDEEQIMSGLEVDEDDAESGASVSNIESQIEKQKHGSSNDRIAVTRGKRETRRGESIRGQRETSKQSSEKRNKEKGSKNDSLIVVEDEKSDSTPKKKSGKSMWDKADANSSQPLVKRSNNFLQDQSVTDQQNENNNSERQPAPASTS